VERGGVEKGVCIVWWEGEMSRIMVWEADGISGIFEWICGSPSMAFMLLVSFQALVPLTFSEELLQYQSGLMHFETILAELTARAV